MQKTVLVVDDAAVVRQMVSLTLQGAGCTIITAVNGNDALSKLESTSVDMVITDLNMPEMDGITLVREIRKKEACKFTPIVMLTTVSQEEKKKDGAAAGASGWIYKPFNPRQLLEVVHKFLG